MNRFIRRVYDECRAIPGWRTEGIYSNGAMVIGVLPSFKVRFLIADCRPGTGHEPNEQEVLIQLAYRPTFDRWANSVNFETRRSMRPLLYYPLFTPQYRWAIKVVRTGLFDFNSYLSPIELPWLGKAKRNRAVTQAT